MSKGVSSLSKNFGTWVDRFFMISERKSTVGAEVRGGVVDFMNMAYIIPVQAGMMAVIGLNYTGIALAVCLISAVITFAMGVYAKMPVALAPGMGMNALMAYTLVLGNNYPPSFVLFCIMIEGVLFFIFSCTKIREAVIRAIPYQLKMGISMGIGLFIAYIGLQNSGLVVGNASTLTGLINFKENPLATFYAVLTFVGVLLIIALMIRGVKGAMLIGMFGIWGIGIICQVCGIYTPNAEAGYYSLIPSWQPTDYSALASVIGLSCQPDFQALFDMGMTLFEVILATFTVILIYFYTDTFDTAGTTTGCAYQAGLLDEDGNFSDMGKVMRVDSSGTFFGSLFGLSPITVFVESGSGIAAGARTGLAAVVAGFCFLLAMPFSSILTATPSFATSATLIVVGIVMATAGQEIDWENESMLTLAPVFICMISMFAFYSISEGIAAAIVTYVALHVLAGKAKEVNKLLYVLFVIFILKYIFL